VEARVGQRIGGRHKAKSQRWPVIFHMAIFGSLYARFSVSFFAPRVGDRIFAISSLTIKRLFEFLNLIQGSRAFWRTLL
jgi:hypothetical protein